MIHIPVMLEEVINFLNLKQGDKVIDATVGAAGHSQEIVMRIQPDGILIGIDQDKEILQIAAQKLEKYQSVFLFKDNFVNINKILKRLKINKVNAILFDLGVSSLQLDNQERGFSFLKDGPLDMRMDKENQITADYLVNHLSEKELAEIIYNYGEERWAKRIAKFIVEYRKKQKIKSTLELVEIIRKAIPAQVRKKMKIHYATRTFQALRITVNKELDNLEKGLNEAAKVLDEGGRLCVISFHSLEDRIVKNFFQQNKNQFKILTPKPVIPSFPEIKNNLRARSAKLRAGEKIEEEKEK